MANQPRPLFRLTVRKTVHLATTLEVFAAPDAPPRRPVITVEGETVADSELPPSQPSIRSARPANVVQFPVRRVAGQRGVGFLNCVAGLALVALFCEVCKLAGWQ